MKMMRGILKQEEALVEKKHYEDHEGNNGH